MLKLKILRNLKLIYLKLIVKPEVETYVFSLFMLSNILLLMKIIGGSAWILIAFFLLLTFALYIKIHNLLYSFFLVSIYSLQFYTPNKYYSVSVFKPSEIAPNYQGYLLAYGLNIKNIFLTVSILLTVRKLFIEKAFVNKKFPLILLILTISGLSYFLVSLYSSYRYSPYFELSFVWLLQQTMMFFVAFIILYNYIKSRVVFNLINTVLILTLFLQSLIGVLQFFKQASIGLPIENAQFVGAVNYGATDVVTSLVRSSGTFAHPNQFGLILTILIVITLPRILTQKKVFDMLVLISSVVAILVTQSRSAWL